MAATAVSLGRAALALGGSRPLPELLGAAGVAYASLVERNLFTLRRFDVPVLPADARPIRVLQLSDLHLVPRQQRKIEEEAA